MGRINLVSTVAMDVIRIRFPNQSFKKTQQMINLSQRMVRAYGYKKPPQILLRGDLSLRGCLLTATTSSLASVTRPTWYS